MLNHRQINKAQIKMLRLERMLKRLGRVVLAFSGGVDSTFLLRMAIDTLGRKNVIAVIAKSETYPEREFSIALKFVRRNKINYRVINTRELSIKGFSKNPANRCYFCKKELFSRLIKIKKKMKYNAVLDGTNYDDRLDIRHGSKARDELKVLSPLEAAEITKKEIRVASKSLGLSTYNKPSFACLASRFPYDSEITKRELVRVDKAEKFLQDLGFSQVRVRNYGNTSRIELYPSEMKKVLKKLTSRKIVRYFKTLGYTYITVDLEGYRTGSMNL